MGNRDVRDPTCETGSQVSFPGAQLPISTLTDSVQALASQAGSAAMRIKGIKAQVKHRTTQRNVTDQHLGDVHVQAWI